MPPKNPDKDPSLGGLDALKSAIEAPEGARNLFEEYKNKKGENIPFDLFYEEFLQDLEYYNDTEALNELKSEEGKNYLKQVHENLIGTEQSPEKKINEFYDKELPDIYKKLKQAKFPKRVEWNDVVDHLKSTGREDFAKELDNSPLSYQLWTRFRKEQIDLFNTSENQGIDKFLASISIDLLDDKDKALAAYQAATKLTRKENADYFLAKLEVAKTSFRQQQSKDYRAIAQRVGDSAIAQAMIASFESTATLKDRDKYLNSDDKEGIKTKVAEYAPVIAEIKETTTRLAPRLEKSPELKAKFDQEAQKYDREKRTYDANFYSPKDYLKFLGKINEELDKKDQKIEEARQKIEGKTFDQLPTLPDADLTYEQFKDELKKANFYGIDKEVNALPEVRAIIRRKNEALHAQWLEHREADIQKVLYIVESKSFNDVPDLPKKELNYNEFRDELKKRNFYPLTPTQFKNERIRAAVQKKNQELHEKWLTERQKVLDKAREQKEAAKLDAFKRIDQARLPSDLPPDLNFKDFCQELLDVKIYDIPHETYQIPEIKEAAIAKTEALFSEYQANQKSEKKEAQEAVPQEIINRINTKKLNQVKNLPPTALKYENFKDLLKAQNFYKLTPEESKNPHIRRALRLKNQALLDEHNRLQENRVKSALTSIKSRTGDALKKLTPEAADSYEAFRDQLKAQKFYDLDSDLFANENIRKAIRAKNEALYKKWSTQQKKIQASALESVDNANHKATVEAIDTFGAKTAKEAATFDKYEQFEKQFLTDHPETKAHFFDRQGYKNLLRSYWADLQLKEDQDADAESSEIENKDDAEKKKIPEHYQIKWNELDERLNPKDQAKGIDRFSRLLGRSESGLQTLMQNFHQPLGTFLIETLATIPQDRFDRLMSALKDVPLESNNKGQASEWLKTFCETIGIGFLQKETSVAFSNLKQNYQTYFGASLSKAWEIDLPEEPVETPEDTDVPEVVSETTDVDIDEELAEDDVEGSEEEDEIDIEVPEVDEETLVDEDESLVDGGEAMVDELISTLEIEEDIDVPEMVDDTEVDVPPVEVDSMIDEVELEVDTVEPPETLDSDQIEAPENIDIEPELEDGEVIDDMIDETFVDDESPTLEADNEGDDETVETEIDADSLDIVDNTTEENTEGNEDDFFGDIETLIDDHEVTDVPPAEADSADTEVEAPVDTLPEEIPEEDETKAEKEVVETERPEPKPSSIENVILAPVQPESQEAEKVEAINQWQEFVRVNTPTEVFAEERPAPVTINKHAKIKDWKEVSVNEKGEIELLTDNSLWEQLENHPLHQQLLRIHLKQFYALSDEGFHFYTTLYQEMYFGSEYTSVGNLLEKIKSYCLVSFGVNVNIVHSPYDKQEITNKEAQQLFGEVVARLHRTRNLHFIRIGFVNGNLVVQTDNKIWKFFVQIDESLAA